jgi:glycosyltransferase involved in cell wall biosynthesis
VTPIYITTWNRPQFIGRVVKGIQNNTLSPHKLVVFDNGSDEPAREEITKLYKDGWIDQVIWNPQNSGLEFARQTQLELTETPRFVTTDSDCIPHKPHVIVGYDKKDPKKIVQKITVDWLQYMNKLMDKNSDYAAIAARTQVMIGSGDIFGENPPPIVDFTCGGSLRLMNTEVIRKLGGWEPVQPGRGNEEHKICNKIREAGFKCGFASNVPCYHLFGEGNWGYSPLLAPEQHGHRPISHPALTSGDDPELLKDYE